MRLQTSTDVRRYLMSILARLEAGTIDRKMAETLSNIAYKLQMSIQSELKEKELEQMETLAEELRKAKGVKK